MLTVDKCGIQLIGFWASLSPLALLPPSPYFFLLPRAYFCGCSFGCLGTTLA